MTDDHKHSHNHSENNPVVHDHQHDHSGAPNHSPQQSHRDGHSHAHGHAHVPQNFDRAFLIGIILNISFVGIEAGYGVFSNSLALLADAGHNLSDVLGLVIAWVAIALSKRKPDHQFTFGLKGSPINSSGYGLERKLQRFFEQ